MTDPRNVTPKLVLPLAGPTAQELNEFTQRFIRESMAVGDSIGNAVMSSLWRAFIAPKVTALLSMLAALQAQRAVQATPSPDGHTPHVHRETPLPQAKATRTKGAGAAAGRQTTEGVTPVGSRNVRVPGGGGNSRGKKG